MSSMHTYVVNQKLHVFIEQKLAFNLAGWCPISAARFLAGFKQRVERMPMVSSVLDRRS